PSCFDHKRCEEEEDPMLVEPKSLVRRLTPTATRYLEAAVSRASSGNFYEIVVEHLLLELLGDEQGEPAMLLQHYGVDRLRLAARVESGLSKLRTGNSGRPVFAEALFQWLEDACRVASVEWGAVKLRSGAILAQLAARPGRYTSDVFAELERLPREELRRELDQLLSGTPEALELEVSVGRGPSEAEAKGGQQEALRRYAVCFTEKA